MPSVIRQRENTDFRHLAWLLPYYLDWGPCGQEVFLLRGYATVLRWFEDPGDRAFQIEHLRERVAEGNRALSPQLEQNLTDLLDSDGALGPWLPAGLFGLFLMRLERGDLITGGPTDPGWPPNLVEIRPGFFFALTIWQELMPDLAFPWPFWMFPNMLNPDIL